MALNHWITGEEVDAADFQAENTEFLTLIGSLAQIFFGVQSFQGGMFPLLAVPSGQNVIIGGPRQQCNIGNRLCRDILPATFPITLNPGAVVRTDMLYGYGIELDRTAFTRTVRNPDRSVTPTTVYQTAHDVQWQFVPGNADGTLGSPPGGYQPVAKILAQPNNAALQPANVVVVLPTLQSIIDALVTTVGSLNGLTGALTLARGLGISITTDAATGTITIGNTGVASFLGSTGAVNLESTDGSVHIAAVPGGANLTVPVAAPFDGVTSVQGAKGAVRLHSANGTVLITPVADGADLSVSVPASGVTSLEGNTGALRLTSLDETVIIGAIPGGVNLSAINTVAAGGSTPAAFGRYDAVPLTVPAGAWFFEVDWVCYGANLQTLCGLTSVSGGSWKTLGVCAGEASEQNSSLNALTAVSKLVGQGSFPSGGTITFQFHSNIQNTSEPNAVAAGCYAVKATRIPLF